MTIVSAPDDDPQYMRMAFQAHQPRFGHITLHPTPMGGQDTHLAHDLIRCLGKHLPLPGDPHRHFGVGVDGWHIAAAWSLALSINRLTVCRAHLLRLPKWRHLLAFGARTGIQLTMLCNGPIPRDVLSLLDTVPHRTLDGPDTAADHWRTPAGHQELDGHPWWQHHAAFPPPDDEPWLRLPPQPRRRLTAQCRFRPVPAEQGAQPLAPGQGRYDITVIADRIHTRIAHPQFAACAAIRALTGHLTHQMPAFYEDPSIHFPFIPPWAAILLDAAGRLREVGGKPSINSHWLVAGQEDADVDKALRDCRLLTT
ncbi:hypothetical protein [Streptomyces chartreusis]|uniref:hypothetical protein n=1 Tax=Streptomyces chartreusis TaxID=1969 RepID=UPI003803A814